jgi:hypothetical protein
VKNKQKKCLIIPFKGGKFLFTLAKRIQKASEKADVETEIPICLRDG